MTRLLLACMMPSATAVRADGAPLHLLVGFRHRGGCAIASTLTRVLAMPDVKVRLTHMDLSVA